MSVIKCKNCFKDVDTDYDEVMVFLDKYYYCQNCCDKDEIFELLDEMQTKIDGLTRKNEVMKNRIGHASNCMCLSIAAEPKCTCGYE